jgi:predicted benzoate:H+ symporter BenE
MRGARIFGLVTSDGRQTMDVEHAGPTRPALLQECSGACGDFGTFLPHVTAALTVAGLAPAGVLLGFGVTLIGSGLFYGVPIAVQPMKAVSAVLLTGGLGAGEVAAAGMMLGAILLALGGTGLIGRIAGLIPRSVTAGLQLGLGLSMGALGLGLVLRTPWLGGAALALLLLLGRLPRLPAVPLMVVAACAAGWLAGEVALPSGIGCRWQLPALVVPSWAELWQGFGRAALPQLPLTLTNAVIVTAALCRELYPERAPRASERNLALTSGLANLLLSPLGAMPMCHGAGGLQAQHRFGARTGLAPLLLGLALLVLALGFADGAARLFAVIPIGAVGALLLVAGADLALSRRLLDARPSCWPAIGITAAATLLANPAAGLVAGWATELVRSGVRSAIRPDRRITPR